MADIKLPKEYMAFEDTAVSLGTVSISVPVSGVIWSLPEDVSQCQKKHSSFWSVADEVENRASGDCIRLCTPFEFIKPSEISEINGSWPITKEFEGRASDSCVEFCNSLGLIDDLRNCLNQLENTFSNIKCHFAELDYFQDEDAEDQGHIVFGVKVQSSREVSKAEHNKWINWLVESITDDKRQFFVLDLVRI